jgi:hypothetical protein
MIESITGFCGAGMPEKILRVKPDAEKSSFQSEACAAVEHDRQAALASGAMIFFKDIALRGQKSDY